MMAGRHTENDCTRAAQTPSSAAPESGVVFDPVLSTATPSSSPLSLTVAGSSPIRYANVYSPFFSRPCQQMFPNPSGRGSGGSGPFGSRSGGLHPTESGIKRADPTGASRLDPARGPQQPLSPSAQATQAFAEGHVPANPQNDPFLPRRVEHGLTGRAEMPGNGVFNPNYPGLPDDRRNILPRSGDERQGDVHNRPMMPGKLGKLQHF